MATSSFYNSSGSTPTQATDIATSVDQAQDAAQEAEATLNEFKTLYMGIYSTAPVASQTGSLYYNDTTHLLYYWNGTNWTQLTPQLQTLMVYRKGLSTSILQLSV